ncbi:hypothetical protein [Pararhodobacter sp. SW119]|uniref:hypothetical protein n=1 Tax=Pararhodobacter sp. SW119 TaxID=2780075 RepID=UPI001ADFE4E5|nr:hypothetical protein [Pararhodobacter sp. SW119]
MIIPYNDASSAEHHGNTLFSKDTINDGDVPWVKVGNLYMSICITGENSYGPLAKDLSSGKKVWVFTGRHGEATGNPLKDDGTFLKKRVYDIEHKKEDAKIVDGLKKSGFNVEMLDLYEKNDARTTGRLRELIKEKLDKGEAVVLAWCFSLFAMDEFSAGMSKGAAQTTAETNYKKSVNAIVAANYSWVPKPW